MVLPRASLGRDYQRYAVAAPRYAELESDMDAPEAAAVAPRAAATTGPCGLHGGSCETSSGPSLTLPIAIGIAVPVVIALVLFIYLHRRHVKRLRVEDAAMNHRSLDFGFEPNSAQNKKRKRGVKGLDNVDPEKRTHNKGMSLDMDLAGPYMLPPEMHQSTDSLQSLSRSLRHNAHDPYQSVAMSDGASSIRGSPRGGDDNMSTRTGATASSARRNLLRNAQRMSHTQPPETASVVELPPPDAPHALTLAPEPVVTAPGPVEMEHPSTPPIPERRDRNRLAAELDVNPRQSTASHDVNIIRRSNNYLANFIQSREASIERHSATPSVETRSVTSPPPAEGMATPPIERQPSPLASRDAPTLPTLNIAPTLPQISLENEFPGSTGLQYTEIVVPPPADAASRTPSTRRSPAAGSPSVGSPALATPMTETTDEDWYDPDEEVPDPPAMDKNYLAAPNTAPHRLSIGRPLPLEDPSDTAEQRANRIRSFYKEYFNEKEVFVHAPQAADYYEDYGSEYLGDPTIYDPATGQFVVSQAPFAAPVTRRAMTPPPRAPPRFAAGPGGPRGGSRAGSGHPSPNPSYARSRAYSTVSARTPRQKRPAPPPPKALNNLPTPHLLRDDNIALLGSIDFAPPPRFKEQAAGRPQSPFLDQRPYSPSVRVANPLASSFTDLPSMPSPHLLRRSGTFTALDFAPPPRIRDRENAASDAGSIRSGRSNGSAMSSAQMQSLRAGAYRLSRIPTALVGSRQEFADSLRPTWHVGTK